MNEKELKDTDNLYRYQENTQQFHKVYMDENLPPDTFNFQVSEQVGKFIVNTNLTFGFAKKPNLFHRWMTRLLLGWIWKDEK